MKKLTKSVIATAGVALACQGAFAQNANDLLIGFNGFTVAGVSSDYIADLGASSTILSGGPNQNLSSSLTGIVPAYSASLNVGVVAGATAGAGGTGDNVFMTTVRLGGGSYLSAGTEGTPGATSRSGVTSAANDIANVPLGTTPSADPSGSNPSWSEWISAGPGQPGSGNANYVAALYGTKANPGPMVNFGGSSVIVEDLWQAVRGSSASVTWTYEGDLTIDLSGANPSVIFDAAPTPEPSTYGILTLGVGILFLVRRRRQAA